MSYYPKIPEDVVNNITIARKLAAEQPDYLSHNECPYGRVVSEFLSGVGGTGSGKASGGTVRLDSLMDIEKEITDTYTEMGNEKPNGNDPSALQGYYRTRTALMTKLVELRDKTLNQKMIGEFYTEVLAILDEIATPTQRSIFAEKLERFAGNE